MKMTYETCCVNSDAESIEAMTDAALEGSFKTFRRRCDTTEWERRQGYDVGHERGGLRLRRDWHVSYHRSTYQGRPCYYAVHSAIEHIFT